MQCRHNFFSVHVFQIVATKWVAALINYVIKRLITNNKFKMYLKITTFHRLEKVN